MVLSRGAAPELVSGRMRGRTPLTLGAAVLALAGSLCASPAEAAPGALPAGCNRTGVFPSTNVACVYHFTGGVQTFTVPAGVLSLRLNLIGAAGDDSCEIGQFGPTAGGRGAEVFSNLRVTPGQVLQVFVGGKGGTGSHPMVCGDGPGGFNGGGRARGGGGVIAGGGGGGASDIRSGLDVSQRLAVAGGGGGGGGAGIPFPGGAGGSAGRVAHPGQDGHGEGGGNGGRAGSPTAPGDGGTSGTPAPGCTTAAGTAGTFGFGGEGGECLPGNGAGAGGGGGFYGGGGGGAGGRPDRRDRTGGGGGGAGSSKGTGAVATGVATPDGNGVVTINYFM